MPPDQKSLPSHSAAIRATVAGHPPLVHLPRGGQPRFLAGNGFAVGMMDDIEFEEHKVQLQPGDRVYWYSDGVPEAMNEKLEQFTNPRMVAVLSECASKPLSASVDELFDKVRQWCVPKGPKDDVSILGCELASTK